MYREFFKLHEHPFSLTPDTDFWFDAAGHRDSMNVLCAMLRLGEGFIKVSAEIGLGKTLLCRPYGLISTVAEEIGAGAPDKFARDGLMKVIRNRLLYLARQGMPVVLVIDEAHQLPDVTLEALRLLTNLETEKYKLLQVVIVGQPELDLRLAQPSMRQLNQRISFSCTADCRSELRFSDAAIRQICKSSQGIPRIINVLCHKTLMVAYGRGEQNITQAHVARAIEDTQSILPATSWRNPFATMRGMLFPPARLGSGLNALRGVE